MIRQIIREAWADNPALFVAAVVVTPFAVLAGWVWIVVLAELLRGAGVRP
jgi:hypothetical protein